MDLYAAILAPIAWRVPGHAARMLHGFARAERGSMIDLYAAANLSPSPRRRALYLRHALDEDRHTTMFARRSAELCRARGTAALGPVIADTEQLFERLGEMRFLAFVHLGEARARAQFAAHIRAARVTGDERSAAMLEAISADEAEHERYTRELLVELSGSELEARRAVRRAMAWEAFRLWRRAGRAISGRVYAALMFVLFLAVAPMALLVRIVRPVRTGWVDAPKVPADKRAALPREARS